ncbi:MAG: DUF2878 domain-containing protein [Xanthomonadales bacterium]|nr:DUF2878 domain-containing protein [Xanthomonadales bacterium]
MLKNLLLFKAGWVACVVLAARDQPQLAALAVAAVVLIHLDSVAVPVKEALLLVAAAVVGLVWESFMVWTGLLMYSQSNPSGFFAPYWIVAMWVLFATTINHGLAWVKRNWMMSAGAGLLGGPLAFYAGAGMGAVSFSNIAAALVVIGLGWAVLLPMLVLLADTLIDSTFLEPDSDHRSGTRPLTVLAARNEPNA